MLGTLPAHIFQLLLQALYLAADDAAISLKLGFSGAAGADTSTQSFQMLPLTGEPGQEILVLREFHLETSFPGPRPGRKDIEDECDPVDDLDTQSFFDVPLLYRRQFIINDKHIIIKLIFEGDQFLEFPLPDIAIMRRRRQLLYDLPRYLRSGGFG